MTPIAWLFWSPRGILFGGGGLIAKWCQLWDSMDYSLPCSSVLGILQARMLEWVAISFSIGSSQPRDQTQGSRIAGRCFSTAWATREALIPLYGWINPTVCTVVLWYLWGLFQDPCGYQNAQMLKSLTWYKMAHFPVYFKSFLDYLQYLIQST